MSWSALWSKILKMSQQDFSLPVYCFIRLHFLPISSILQYRSQMLSTVLGKENEPGLVLLSFILSLIDYLLTKHGPDTSPATLRMPEQERTLRAVYGERRLWNQQAQGLNSVSATYQYCVALRKLRFPISKLSFFFCKMGRITVLIWLA